MTGRRPSISSNRPILCWAMQHWKGFFYPFSIRTTRRDCIAAWEDHTGRRDAPYGHFAPNRPVKVLVTEAPDGQ